MSTETWRLLVTAMGWSSVASQVVLVTLCVGAFVRSRGLRYGNGDTNARSSVRADMNRLRTVAGIEAVNNAVLAAMLAYPLLIQPPIATVWLAFRVLVVLGRVAFTIAASRAIWYFAVRHRHIYQGLDAGLSYSAEVCITAEREPAP